jgi:hypothetical protein
MIKKIISGGQTGVDQAALDAAINLNVPYGGQILNSRKTEDEKLPGIYQLKEIPAESCSKPTEQNIIASDGTLIISHGKLTGGSEFIRKMAIKHKRPWFHVDLDQTSTLDAITSTYTWIDTHEIEILNVAGPRAGKDPKIYESARDILEAVICLDRVETNRESSLEKLFALPGTIFEAVERLISDLTLKDKVKIAHLNENDLGELDFSLGAYIKNEFGLQMGNEELLESCLLLSGQDEINEDEVVSLIVKELWKKLKKSHRLRLVK